MRMNVLIMENLFYERRFSKVGVELQMGEYELTV